MPALDFKEIPTAAAGAGRDQFELFAREFLDEVMGFRIIVGPDRGADAGRDMVVEEVRTGVVGETRVRWLVSCKHKAHMGTSVSADDEPDIHDRVKTHACNGFMGFYSTVPSAGLAAKLNATGRPFEVQTYDAEKIETQLLGSPVGRKLAERFFPASWAKWRKEHPRPADLLFRDPPALSCAYCHKSLLEPEPHGIVVGWTTYSADGGARNERTERVYWCCKGACDQALNARFRTPGVIDGWKDIADLIIPMEFIRWVCVCFNEFHSGMTYSEDAIKNMRALLINLFPLTCRDMTEVEKERIKSLMPVPSYIGGWGYEC